MGVSKRHTVGLQLQTLYDEYSKKLWPSAVEAARHNDVNLIVFHGESLKVPYGYAYQCNILYDLISKNDLDAMIWCTNTLGNWISREELAAFLARFNNIPAVCLSVPVPGYPSILVDNRQGIRESVNHLVHEHGRRRIAYISGPLLNFEARARLEFFTAGLAENGLEEDRALFVEGDFQTESGRQAVIELLDKRGVSFDALMAGNDVMAIGAMRELQRRGLNVPKDVSVIGFDDVIRCLNVFPPLTSVRQPSFRQVRLAVQMAIDLASGRSVPETTLLPTSLVVRASCGCLSVSQQVAGVLFRQERVFSSEQFSFHTDYLETEINALIEAVDYLGKPLETVREEVWAIIERLEAVVRGEEDPYRLLEDLSRMLYDQIQANATINYFSPVFLLLSEYTFKCFEKETRYPQIVMWFSEILTVIQDNIRATEISNRLSIENNEVRLSLIQQIISSSLTMEEILLNCTKYLPQYDINSFYICAFDKKQKHFQGDRWIMPKKILLLCAFDQRRKLQYINPEGEVCRERELVPAEYLDHEHARINFVFPLHFLEDHYGYIVYEMGTRDPNVYDFFRFLIATSFYTANVLTRRMIAEKGLTRALDDLKNRNEEYRTLSENLPDIILRITPLHSIAFISSNISQYVDVSSHMLVGTPARELPLFREIRDLIDGILDGVIRSGTNEEVESSYQGTQGAKIFNIRFIPEFVDKQHIAFVLGIVQDITELKKIEERLLHMEKMQAIGELAGGIAHDFNNQLAVIIGTIDMMQTIGNYDRQTMGYIENIRTSANQAASLTNQLLAFARKGKFLNTRVDLHQVIRDVISLVSNTIGKNITIECALAASRSIILGDPSQLQNAILNLCINAIDAMPNGGRIMISTEERELGQAALRKFPFKMTPGEFLLVRIKDEGVGMDTDIKRHIFEPFFTTKAPGKGTGMGLAAVFGTVKNHRGAIDVDTSPGCGSCFELYFPILKEETPTDTFPGLTTQVRADGVKLGARTGAGSENDGLRVLLVDDEAIVREVTAEILKRLGHTVTVCADGFDALEKMKKAGREIDVVFLDLIMPGLNGEKTFWGIKAISDTARIILISGYSLNEQVQGLLDAGADAFIQKPYTQGRLAEVINRVMAYEPRRGSAGPCSPI
ncbi:MAG TPA: response regulator [Spirochaetia bacterium]|nr:response regulator [Spirochaetia bacterium]